MSAWIPATSYAFLCIRSESFTVDRLNDDNALNK